MKKFFKIAAKWFNSIVCRVKGHEAHAPYEEVFKEWEMVNGKKVYLQHPERNIKCQCRRCGVTLIKTTGVTISRTKLRILKNKYLKESA